MSLCFCTHRKGSHDTHNGVCTLRGCRCLQYSQSLGTAAHVREQFTPIAADYAARRKTRLQQLDLRGW